MRKRRDRVFSCAGDRFRVDYDPVIMADGSFELVEAGKTDLQEYIDSFKESVSIEHILAMCAAGDTSALQARQGTYIDTTEMPKTFRDMLDIVIRGKTQFESLPVEVKQKFDNDFNKWFADAGSQDWLLNMGFIEPVKPEVKETKTDAE